jgi:hypothetical protein
MVFLPNKQELKSLYDQKVAEVVAGDFPSVFYWSSSEISSDGAWIQDFSGTFPQSVNGKGLALGVRAVRAF